MKVGDLVMFNDGTSLYAKWFYGQLGIVESYTAVAKSDGEAHCRVRWLAPVKYYGKHATYSDFAAANFEVYDA